MLQVKQQYNFYCDNEANPPYTQQATVLAPSLSTALDLIKKRGWIITDDGKHICSYCVTKGYRTQRP